MNKLLKKVFARLGINWVVIPGIEGLHFNTISWEIAKAVLGVVAGISFAIVLKITLITLIFFTPLRDGPLGWFSLTAIAIAIAAMIWKTNDKTDTLVVPETKKAAYMLLLGMSLNLYFWTSDYRGVAKFYLRRSTKVMEPFTDSSGYIEMGLVQYHVWDNRDAEPGSPERSKITAPTKNRPEIKGQLTLVLETFKPRLMLDFKDASAHLGDRTREEFRELTGILVDTDIPYLGSVLREILVGKRMVTFFIKKGTPGHKQGAIVRNESDELIFEMVENGETTEDAAIRLTKTLFQTADRDMIKHVASSYTKDNETGNEVINLKWSVVEVKRPIEDLITQLGYRLRDVIFADLEFSDKVKEAAEATSAELDERAGQLASASTINAVSEALTPTDAQLKNPGFERAQMIAAAQDAKSGNIKIIHISGSDNNPLTTAAVVGASQIGGNT